MGCWMLGGGISTSDCVQLIDLLSWNCHASSGYYIYIDDIVHDGIGVTPHRVVISEYLGSSRRCWLVRVFSEWTMRCLSRMLSCRHFVLPCCHLNHPSIAFSIQVSWHKNWNFGSEYYSSSQIYTCLAPALQFLILSLKHKLIVTSIEAETDKNLSLSLNSITVDQYYIILHHITVHQINKSVNCPSRCQACGCAWLGRIFPSPKWRQRWRPTFHGSWRSWQIHGETSWKHGGTWGNLEKLGIELIEPDLIDLSISKHQHPSRMGKHAKETMGIK